MWTQLARVVNNGNGEAGMAFMVGSADVSMGTYYAFRIQNFYNNFRLTKRVSGVENEVFLHDTVGGQSGTTFSALCRVDWIADSARFGGVYIHAQATYSVMLDSAAPTTMSWEIIDTTFPLMQTVGQGVHYLGTGGGGLAFVARRVPAPLRGWRRGHSFFPGAVDYPPGR